MRFCRSSLYSNLLGSYSTAVRNVYTRRLAFIWLHARARWLGKTRSQRAGGFLEAFEREACRLDRSEGSLYDVLRPVYLRTK